MKLQSWQQDIKSTISSKINEAIDRVIGVLQVLQEDSKNKKLIAIMKLGTLLQVRSYNHMMK
jgi:hypothetical protein